MRKMSMRILGRVLLLAGLLLPFAQPVPVYAQDEEIGYLWSLYFDFEQDFNGVLTIEVGPWENGNLVEVTESSTTRVRCTRVGNVQLNGGHAVFDGTGYLTCAMDLAAIVAANHGLVIDDVDDYGSIVLRTRALAATTSVMPIFTHPDAAYTLDFSQTWGVTHGQDLWNNAGLLQASFPGVSINTWNVHTMLYSCISNGGPCDATFMAGPQVQTIPTAGSRVQWSTGPTVFEIGYDNGTFFNGRMDALLIDPGNSAH